MKRQEIINSIVEKANSYPTNTEKLKYVYDWFVENVKYAYDYLFLAETESYFAEKYFGDASGKNQSQAQLLLVALKGDVNKNFEDVKTKLQKNGKVTYLNKDITDIKDIELAKSYWQISYKPEFDCFEKKCGVCQTLAEDFNKICKLINIPCIKVSGTTLPKNLGHDWNAVEIDGKILHVDLTYAIYDKDKGKKDTRKFFLTTEKDLLKNSKRVISDKSKQALKTFAGSRNIA